MILMLLRAGYPVLSDRLVTGIPWSWAMPTRRCRGGRSSPDQNAVRTSGFAAGSPTDAYSIPTSATRWSRP